MAALADVTQEKVIMARMDSSWNFFSRAQYAFKNGFVARLQHSSRREEDSAEWTLDMDLQRPKFFANAKWVPGHGGSTLGQVILSFTQRITSRLTGGAMFGTTLKKMEERNAFNVQLFPYVLFLLPYVLFLLPY